MISFSRHLPLLFAGVICFFSSMAIGSVLWYVTAPTRTPELLTHRTPAATSTLDKQSPEARSVPVISETVNADPVVSPATIPDVASEVFVRGGEVMLGGGSTGLPPRRSIVEPFAISETEVTNEQYARFVAETNHPAPAGWRDKVYPAGTAGEPVRGVTWEDANAFCVWLSRTRNVTARLPTEAEWELAARGVEGLTYPWGNEWDNRAAASAETNGSVRAVKSYAANRSPCGAYDMAGNVWEWVADDATGDGSGARATAAGVRFKIAKGGAANEKRALVNATSRQEIPSDIRYETLGFRYVIANPVSTRGRS